MQLFETSSAKVPRKNMAKKTIRIIPFEGAVTETHCRRV
jgi:hypothetical protein